MKRVLILQSLPCLVLGLSLSACETVSEPKPLPPSSGTPAPLVSGPTAGGAPSSAPTTASAERKAEEAQPGRPQLSRFSRAERELIALHEIVERDLLTQGGRIAGADGVPRIPVRLRDLKNAGAAETIQGRDDVVTGSDGPFRLALPDDLWGEVRSRLNAGADFKKHEDLILGGRYELFSEGGEIGRYTWLELAALDNQPEMIHFLLGAGSERYPFKRLPGREDLFLLATQRQNIDAVKALLKARIEPMNAQDSEVEIARGQTIIAAWGGVRSFLEYMIPSEQEDIRKLETKEIRNTDEERSLAYHRSAREHFLEIARLLEIPTDNLR